MAFMTLLIGVFNPLTLERVRHFPHPRPIIEETATPTNSEPHHVRVALGTNEATPAGELQRKIRIQRTRTPPPPQKQTPKSASLNGKSNPKGLRIFTYPRSSWFSARTTMTDTVPGWL